MKAFWKDGLQAHKKVLHGFIDPIVVSAIARKKAGRNVAETGEETLLQNLVNSTEGVLKTSILIKRIPAVFTTAADPILLRDEIMNLLVAGRDTVRASHLIHCFVASSIYRLLALSPSLFICWPNTRMFSNAYAKRYYLASELRASRHTTTSGR